MMAWVYLGTYVVGICVNALILLRINPEVIAERAQQMKADTKDWDRVLASTWGLLSLVVLLIAGLNMRF